MGGLAKIVSSLVLSVSLASCLPPVLAIYDDLKPIKPNITDDYSDLQPSKKAIEVYLYRINESKFLKDKEEIKREIADNQYGILKKERNTSNGEISGFYRLLPEQVFLSEDLFVQVEKEISATYYYPPVRNPLPILIHELFHDFWFNNLISDEYKENFSIEVKTLYNQIIKSKSLEQKINFLKEVGYLDPKETNFEAFEKLTKRREGYTDEDFFSNELYSIIAELTLAEKIIIPKQLRKYYEPLVSDKWLNKSKLK